MPEKGSIREAILAELRRSRVICPRCKNKKWTSSSCPNFLCSHQICTKCGFHQGTHALEPTLPQTQPSIEQFLSGTSLRSSP